MAADFVVTKGLHSKGSCVVVRQGDIELWLEAKVARTLGREILKCAESLVREDRAIVRRVRVRRKNEVGLVKR